MPSHFHNLLFHGVCLAVYAIPVFWIPTKNTLPTPVLDEFHIVENGDISKETTDWTTIFTNDYWGRPMTAQNSHKSWRPLSILSFRFFSPAPEITAQKTSDPKRALGMHRLVNIVTHAAVAELVSVLGLQLVPPAHRPHRWTFRWLTKLIFVLHPTHVEVTANAANRPHLLAILWAVLLANPQTPWPFFLIALLAGFLSSETFLFATVPAAVTLFAIRYQQDVPLSGSTPVGNHLWKDTLAVAKKCLARWICLGLGGVVYFAGRYWMDWLAIPDGLIRPAENPFFLLLGTERFFSYAYVTALHILKSWDLDVIGFSHEYGFACVPPVHDWETDTRIRLPVAVAALYMLVLWYLCIRTIPNQKRWSTGFLLFLVHCSWMLTLFPITGIVKVGTFIADRIVVASTVSTCIVQGLWISSWLAAGDEAIEPRNNHNSPNSTPGSQSRGWKILLLCFLFVFGWQRIHNRSLEWMDSVPLLESSLRTCPRSAKSHLEMSKIYSGLYPEKFNLNRSKCHLSKVQEIDPSYCDVHYQLAQVAIQEHRYLDFEESLVEALQCPYSMGGSMELWKRYWEMTLNDNNVQARVRYNKYLAILQKAIAKAEAEETEKTSKSPLLIGSWGKKG